MADGSGGFTPDDAQALTHQVRLQGARFFVLYHAAKLIAELDNQGRLSRIPDENRLALDHALHVGQMALSEIGVRVDRPVPRAQPLLTDDAGNPLVRLGDDEPPAGL